MNCAKKVGPRTPSLLSYLPPDLAFSWSALSEDTISTKKINRLEVS